MSVDALADRIVQLIMERSRRGKEYGTVVLAEGLAELLPRAYVEHIAPNEQGFISLAKIDVGKLVAQKVTERYRARGGAEKKITGVQLGYESRCSAPHAFDVLLGSQLGLGAFTALVEAGLDGHMVSVTGQLERRYVPFSDLIDPHTMDTTTRYVDTESDFHELAQSLATRLPE
jgi:6-phosphofructokinase 1